jgi:outer membrane murein-binding lipoprotein Lpp
MNTLKTIGLTIGFTIVLSLLVAGCAGGNNPDKDGLSVAASPDNSQPANYGTGDSQLDRQADENQVNLFRHKTSF